MTKKNATPLDILRLIHPRRNAWMCIVLIPRVISKQEWALIPNFPAILKDPEANRLKQLRWRSTVPYHIWMQRHDTSKILSALKRANWAGWDVYYSLASYQPGAQHRRAEYAEGLTVIYLDFDEQTEASEAFSHGKPYLDIPPPHAIVNTSPGRYQCLWRLDSIYPEMRRVTETIRLLAERTGADSAATDVARVFRLPGYYNNKRGLRNHLVTATINQDLSPVPLRAFSPARAPIELLLQIDNDVRER